TAHAGSWMRSGGRRTEAGKRCLSVSSWCARASSTDGRTLAIPGGGTPMAPAQGHTTSSVVVGHDRGNVGAARHAVAEELRAQGLTPAALEDTVLVVSELVSNSIRHAQPLPSGDICVRWSLDPDHVHVEIVDGGGETRPQAGVV